MRGPLLSPLAQRAAPSRPLSTWLTPASYRPGACQPMKSLHHVIDDAQRTERTQRDIVKAHQTGLSQREFLQNGLRLFRSACVDDENHTLPVGPEIPLVYLAREISIHRVMHFVRHDLGALGGVMGVPMKWEIARIFVVGTGGSGFWAEAAPSGVIGLFCINGTDLAQWVVTESPVAISTWLNSSRYLSAPSSVSKSGRRRFSSWRPSR